MSKKTWILQITPFFSPNVGGVETHLLDLLDYLKNKNYKTTVITYQALVGDKKGLRYEKQNGNEIFRIPWFRGYWYYKTLHSSILHFLYLTPWLFIYSLNFLSQKPKVDIIHAHGVNGAFAAALLKIIFKKPLIVTIHVETNFTIDNLQTKIQLWPLKMADKVLVVTQRTKTNLERFGINKEKISVFSYWVDSNIFKKLSKNDCREKLGISPNRQMILFVGRLTEDKGVKTIFKVAQELKDIDFYLIGSGNLKTWVEENAKKNKNIKYVGRVDNNKLPEYYNSADFLLIPSTVLRPRPTYEESIPRVIVESLYCGLPILGTDNGGIKETIETGQVGVVISDKISKLKQSIEKAIKNTAQRKIWSTKTLEYAQDRFGPKWANRITNIYEEIK